MHSTMVKNVLPKLFIGFFCICLQSTLITGASITDEQLTIRSHSLKGQGRHHNELHGSITWYHNCPATKILGEVTSLTLTNCSSSSNCALNVGEPLRLVLGFIAGGTHSNLDYEIVLASTALNVEKVLAVGSGILNIEAGVEYSIGNNFVLGLDVPPSSLYELRVRRFDNSKKAIEVCVVFDISYVNNEDYVEPTTTTESVPETTTTELLTTTEETIITSTTEGYELTTEETITSTTKRYEQTTTEEWDRTTSHPIYDCQVPGVFPDPYKCTMYHVCQLYPNGTIWDQAMTCALQTVFCDKTKLCEHEPDCPCTVPKFYL